MLCYVVHLALLHVCLGITKLLRHVLNGEGFWCNTITYLFYYCIIACFSWLLLMCVDIYCNLAFYEKILKMESEEMIQNNIKRELEAKRRFLLYVLCTIGIPIVITVILIIIDIFYKSADFYYCLRFQFEPNKAHFDYSFVPFLIIVSGAMILYAQTNSRFRDVINVASNNNRMSSSTKNQMKTKMDHEKKQ